MNIAVSMGHRLSQSIAQNIQVMAVREIEGSFGVVEKAARDVVDALNRLDQEKHTRLETAARRNLEAKARELRRVIRERDERL